MKHHIYKGWEIEGSGGYVTVRYFYAHRLTPLPNEPYSRKYHNWLGQACEYALPNFHGCTLREVKAQIAAIEDGRSTFYALPSWQREMAY